MDAVKRDITAKGVPLGMRAGQRILNDAQLTVGFTDAVPEAMRAKVREITHFSVAPDSRRKRLGTLLLNMVCQEADANAITLLLTAAPTTEDEDAPNEAQLVAFYQRFGFTVLEETPRGTLMARRVHTKPRVAVDPGMGRALLHMSVRAATRNGVL